MKIQSKGRLPIGPVCGAINEGDLRRRAPSVCTEFHSMLFFFFYFFFFLFFLLSVYRISSTEPIIQCSQSVHLPTRSSVFSPRFSLWEDHLRRPLYRVLTTDRCAGPLTRGGLYRRSACNEFHRILLIYFCVLSTMIHLLQPFHRPPRFSTFN